MKRIMVAVLALCSATGGMADVFGTGTNQFTLTFVPISGGSNPSSGIGVVPYDYQIGTYEISAGQWEKFLCTGSVPTRGYGYRIPIETSGSQAANRISWYEAAYFVNWLNVSSGHQAAYNFDASGELSLWGAGEASATSAYRHQNAVYVLPSADEWIKAGYWSGSSVQKYATPDGSMPTSAESNYQSTEIWDIILGARELNGTYNMMGNVWEWTEGAADGIDDVASEMRRIRGGAYAVGVGGIYSTYSLGYNPDSENSNIGFRVAMVPEPAALSLVGLAGCSLLILKRVFTT